MPSGQDRCASGTDAIKQTAGEKTGRMAEQTGYGEISCNEAVYMGFMGKFRDDAQVPSGAAYTYEEYAGSRTLDAYRRQLEMLSDTFADFQTLFLKDTEDMRLSGKAMSDLDEIATKRLKAGSGFAAPENPAVGVYEWKNTLDLKVVVPGAEIMQGAAWSGDGYHIRYADIQEMLQTVNLQLNIWNAAVEQEGSDVTSFNLSGCIKGAGADSMRGYLENVLLPLGSTIQETLRNYLGKLNSYLEDYRFIDSADDAELSTYELTGTAYDHDHKCMEFQDTANAVKGILCDIDDIIELEPPDPMDLVNCFDDLVKDIRTLRDSFVQYEDFHYEQDFSATMEAIDAIYQTSKANVEHDRNGAISIRTDTVATGVTSALTGSDRILTADAELRRKMHDGHSVIRPCAKDSRKKLDDLESAYASGMLDEILRIPTEMLAVLDRTRTDGMYNPLTHRFEKPVDPVYWICQAYHKWNGRNAQKAPLAGFAGRYSVKFGTQMLLIAVLHNASCLTEVGTAVEEARQAMISEVALQDMTREAAAQAVERAGLAAGSRTFITNVGKQTLLDTAVYTTPDVLSDVAAGEKTEVVLKHAAVDTAGNLLFNTAGEGISTVRSMAGAVHVTNPYAGVEETAYQGGSKTISEQMLETSSAKRWGTLNDGTNQGIKHFFFFFFKYPERIPSLAQ